MADEATFTARLKIASINPYVDVPARTVGRDDGSRELPVPAALRQALGDNPSANRAWEQPHHPAGERF